MAVKSENNNRCVEYNARFQVLTAVLLEAGFSLLGTMYPKLQENTAEHRELLSNSTRN
jgi:hypothetical protein